MNGITNARSIRRTLEAEPREIRIETFERRNPETKRREHFHPTKGWRGGPLFPAASPRPLSRSHQETCHCPRSGCGRQFRTVQARAFHLQRYHR